jgi:manganese/zinc/iron transport system substrate-binding protein
MDRMKYYDSPVARPPVLLFLLGAALALGCGDASTVPDSQQVVGCVATVGMVADIVRNVGGERVAVTQIMGSGVDPHLYKATRDDVRSIMTGDIVFYSGLMLEGKMIDTLRKVGETRPSVAVTEAISKSVLLEPEDFAGHYDPHVWMDVSAWSQCVSVVVDTLAAARPDDAEWFAARGEAYRQKLAELDQYAKETIATIPENNRVLITSHDAFNYFGRAYGLEVIGVQGLSTESEAGLQQINALVDLLVERKIGAVFVESSVPRKNIEALIDGAASRGHVVKVGGELYSDAMGKAGTRGGTYVGMIEHNVNTVVAALGGMVPTGGFGATSLEGVTP